MVLGLCQAVARCAFRRAANRVAIVKGQHLQVAKVDPCAPLAALVSRFGARGAVPRAANRAVPRARPSADSGIQKEKHPHHAPPRGGREILTDDFDLHHGRCRPPFCEHVRSPNTGQRPQRETGSIQQIGRSSPRNCERLGQQTKNQSKRTAPPPSGAAEAAEFSRPVRSPRCSLSPVQFNGGK